MQRHYKHATVGGTFDRLHEGHKKLIEFAFQKADYVSVAITSDTFAKKKKTAYEIEPYKNRLKSLKQFLTGKNLYERARFITLEDIYGTALTDNTLDSIVVTSDTRHNAALINRERTKRGLRPLSVLYMRFVHGPDGKIIHSERIREGEIDRSGYSFSSMFSGRKTLLMPSTLREELRKPMGEVVRGSAKNATATIKKVIKKLGKYRHPIVIAVGDIVTQELEKVGFEADIAVKDFKTRREVLVNVNNRNKSQIINKPGTLHPRAVQVLTTDLKQFIRKKIKSRIIIRGEEDLLALPAIMIAPLGSVVLYGLYDVGVVIVRVTEERKAQAKLYLEQFR